MIYSGVIYHLPDPMGSLVKVRNVAKDLVIVETDSFLNHLNQPVATFRGEPEGLISDAPNWWVPNELCLHRMLQVAGFQRSETKYHQFWSNMPIWRTTLKKAAFTYLPRLFPPPLHSRLIVHAWV